MIRILAGAFALVLFVVPLLIAPGQPVAALGALGLVLAALGIGGLWRWPVTAAACVFATDYAGALWLARAPLNVGGAVAFGLALLLMLETVELGRGVRRSTVEPRVVRSQLTAWLGFGAATAAVTMLGLALAGGLAASIPFAAAPFVAAAATLGMVLALATLIRRSP
jgi:hypothetical protein